MRISSPKLNIMYKACMKASKSLIRDFGEVENLQVSSKGPGDFVSSADKRTEKIIIEEILKAYPNHGILSEEIGKINEKNKTNRWIIDPIDGTMNFLNGVPQFAISVAYEENNEILCGVILNPITNMNHRLSKLASQSIDTEHTVIRGENVFLSRLCPK